MKLPLYRSLSGRLALGIILIQVLTLAATGYYYVRAFRSQIDQDRIQRLRAPARLMQRGLLGYETVADARTMRDLTGEIPEEAVLFGFQGNVFHSLNSARLGTNVFALGLVRAEWLEHLPAEGLLVTGSTPPDPFTQAVFPLTPAESQSPFLFLYLKVPTTALAESKRAITHRFLLGSAATLGATSLALIWLFGRLATRRLRGLMQVLGRLEGGDLSSRYIGPNRGDEISLLADGVNAMGQRLEAAFQSLERKVDEANRYHHELQRQKDYLETLLAHLPVAVVVKDVRADCRYLYVNPRASQLYGQPADRLVGRTDQELLSPAVAESVREADRRCFEAKTELQIPRETFRRADGVEASLQTMRVPVLGALGEPWLLLSIAIDITERIKAEEVRLGLEAQLRQAQKMEAIGTLAGGIAHDFNNILAAIIGNAELLALDLRPDQVGQEEVREILKASHRAKGLVQQILTFSRKREVALEPVLLQTVVEEVIRLLRATLPAMIQIRAHLPASIRPVLADPTRMHQLVLNLATNAAQAMGERGGLLEVRLLERSRDQVPPQNNKQLAPAAHWLELSVADSGCGMSAQTLERIFDPFFTTKTHGNGTGLGLAVVHGIVLEHGGVITIDSQVGFGSTFHVFLPATEQQPAASAPAQAPPVSRLPKRVLVVDDEPAVAQVACRLLERWGCNVTVCHDPDTAWRTFSTSPREFDLILTDQRMPQQTGLQLASRIQTVRTDIPILLATGFQDTDSHDLETRHISAVISKPFTPDELRRVLQSVMKPLQPADL